MKDKLLFASILLMGGFIGLHTLKENVSPFTMKCVLWMITILSGFKLCGIFADGFLRFCKDASDTRKYVRESQIVTITAPDGSMMVDDAGHRSNWKYVSSNHRDKKPMPAIPDVKAGLKHKALSNQPVAPVNTDRANLDLAFNMDTYEEPETRPQLLDVMNRDGSFFIWGGRGSGKTYCVSAVIEMKLNAGYYVVIIDPKPIEESIWDARAVRFGANENYDECRKAGEMLLQEKSARSTDYSRVQKGQHFLCVIDELPALNDEMSKPIIEYALPIIKFCRSYNMDVILISQGRTNASTGAHGQADILRESLDFVRIVKNKRTGERHAEYESEGTDPVVMSVDVPCQILKEPVKKLKEMLK